MLIVAILAVVVGALGVLIVAGAPRELVGFTSAGLVTLVAAGVITSIGRWKVSVHTTDRPVAGSSR